MEDPILALMKEYGVELTRENYLRWQYLGQYGDPPAELTAEEEAELPRQFRSNYEEDEDDEEDEAEANPEVKANTDPVHTQWTDAEAEIAWLERHFNNGERSDRRPCPCERCGAQRWINYCRTASQISSDKLRAEGYVQRELQPGVLSWVKPGEK